MAKPRSIKPGQIPEWRPGAEFWKPLADGREVTVYKLLHGKARLCVGPLADKFGYDIAYLYDTLSAAIDAAEMFDGETFEKPPGYARVEVGNADHPTGELPQRIKVHSDALQPNTVIAITKEIRERGIVRETTSAGETDVTDFELLFETEDGKHVRVTAVRRRGDTVSTENNAPHVRIQTVQRSNSPEDVQAVWPHPDNNPD